MPDNVEDVAERVAHKALILKTVSRAREIVADFGARKISHGDQLVDLAARINILKPGDAHENPEAIEEAMAAAAVMFGIATEMMFIQGFTRPLLDKLMDLFEQSAAARMVVKQVGLNREPAAA